VAEKTASIEDLLRQESAPIRRTGAQYLALPVGFAVALGITLFLLLGVLPVVSNAVAWLIELTHDGTTGL
jgi:hypothetical protein